MNVAVVGLGRVGLPLALSFADRGLDVIGVEREPAVLEQSPPGRMPYQETGTQELLERVLASGRPARGPGTFRTPPARRHRAHARHARARAHRDRHVADQAGGRRPAAGAARGPLADPALHRRSRHDRLGGRLHRAAPRLPGRRGPVRRARARADRREPLPRGDRDAAVHRRRRRRGLGRQGGRAVRGVRHRDRPDHAGPGRAGQDLDQHPALHAVRAAQPADDGGRAVRRERVRGDRPDQPRLPARRHRAARADRRRLPAQGLHLLRGALERAGMLLAVSRVHETVPLFLVKGLKRRLGGSLRDRKVAVLGPDLQARLRRRARLALLQAGPPARARAGPRRPPRPARAGRAPSRSRRRSRARTRWSWPPTTRTSRTCSTGCPTASLLVDPWNVTGSGRVFGTVRERAAVE